MDMGREWRGDKGGEGKRRERKWRDGPLLLWILDTLLC